MNKNDHFVGTCTGYNVEGLGVVRHEGLVFFVKNMLVGEEGEIVITSLKKNYGFGKCLNLLNISKHRVEPKCTINNHCGGCQLQHMDRYEQKSFKVQKVKDCFKSIGKISCEVNDILDMDNPYRYRNKVQVPIQKVNGETKIGFYRNHTHEIIEFDDCLVQTEYSNEIIEYCKCLFDELNCSGVFRHVLIKHAHCTNQVMVVVVVKEYPFKDADYFINKLLEKFEFIESVIVNINNNNDNVILSNKEIVVAKKPMIQEKLHDLIFNISSQSFYQINPEQTRVLYDKAIEYAKLNGSETVVDLYCGTGTIGLFAALKAKKVIGIEIVSMAIEDAKENAKINNISNIEFICADAKEGAKQLLQRNEKIDVVIVDPPRKGCDLNTLASINEMNPERIVYVSCDPSTLARDVQILMGFGYELNKVQPVDMFPMTHHVETCVLLSYKNS